MSVWELISVTISCLTLYFYIVEISWIEILLYNVSHSHIGSGNSLFSEIITGNRGNVDLLSVAFVCSKHLNSKLTKLLDLIKNIINVC